MRRRASRILATSHRRGRLPLLREHRASAELLNGLVRALGEEPPADAAALVVRHRSDMRACLRELYDRCAGRG